MGETYDGSGDSSVGKYRVQGKLGRGGMGEVYRAVHTGLQRLVALKVLSETDVARNAKARFLREARVQAQLEHPNLVRLFDAGESGGRLFIAMELVEGRTLSRLLGKEGRPHPSFIAKIGRQMASAYQALHSKGLVHRDIKPSNIMITAGEAQDVKIMDFGIAQLKDGPKLTRTRAVVGTARYLSPEMARGDEVTAKSDLYQLGLVLFELLCGKPPHDGPAAVAIARRAGGERAPDPRKLWPAAPPRLCRLVNALLLADPDRRPGAEEVEEECAALELKLQGWEPAENPPPFKGRGDEDVFAAPTGPIPVAAPSALQPGIGSGKFSNQFPEADDPAGPRTSRAFVFAAAGVATLVGLAGLKAWLTPVEYRAGEVRVTPGARGVVLEWASETAYESRIRYGPAETASLAWTEARAKDDGRKHRLVLEGLEAGVKYRFRVLFPDGGHSLDHSFEAPEPFAIKRVHFHVVGEDAIEWRFRTPVPAKVKVELTTFDGRAATAGDETLATEHALRFRYDDVLRDPREVRARIQTADGELEVGLPRDHALSLFGHLAEVFSERVVRWGSFFNEVDDIRGADDQGTRRPAETRLRVQELVKKRFDASGVLQNWDSVSARVSRFLSDAGPWSERVELIDSLLNLTLVDRMYDLHSLPPVFRAGNLLVSEVRNLPREPDPRPGMRTRKVLFPFDGNLLIPENYSATARGRINTFSKTVFPQKGELNYELTGGFTLPPGRYQEVYLGMETRGLYPFMAVMIDLACVGEDFDQALTVPFTSRVELTDFRLYNEIDFLKAGGGEGLDEIFPVEVVWVKVPREAVCPGENKTRIRLLSLQHLSFFPVVCRRVFVHAVPEAGASLPTGPTLVGG